jgi:hypothetical protein
VLVALGGRDAADRRGGELLQTMIDREQLSLRQAVAWLGDPITVRTATRLLELAHSENPLVHTYENGSSAGGRAAG